MITATVIVAVVGAYIAFQQFWLASERLNRDLFEKRFSVFAAAVSRMMWKIERRASGLVVASAP